MKPRLMRYIPGFYFPFNTRLDGHLEYWFDGTWGYRLSCTAYIRWQDGAGWMGVGT